MTGPTANARTKISPLRGRRAIGMTTEIPPREGEDSMGMYQRTTRLAPPRASTPSSKSTATKKKTDDR